MFQNWLEDRKDTSELTKNHAYLVGSFWNPEAVRELMDKGNTFESSEEDFEESVEMIRNNFEINSSNSDPDKPQRTRRRRTLKD